MCIVGFSQIISLKGLNRVVLVLESQCFFSEVGIKYLDKRQASKTCGHYLCSAHHSTLELSSHSLLKGHE